MLAFLFQDLGAQRPSTIRWYTFPITLALQSLGFLLHRIMPRVLSAALDVDGDEGNGNADAEGGDEVSAWRVYNSKKTRQCLAFVEEDQSPETVCVAASATIPIDKLSGRL